jgi:hypothetical protein
MLEGEPVRQLLEFGTGEDGASVLVEIDQEDPGFERVSRSGRAVQAAQTLETALDAVLPAARVMVEKAQTISPHTSEVEVQFGVRLTASAGAAIASAGGEGHFQLRVLCRRPG